MKKITLFVGLLLISLMVGCSEDPPKKEKVVEPAMVTFDLGVYGVGPKVIVMVFDETTGIMTQIDVKDNKATFQLHDNGITREVYYVVYANDHNVFGAPKPSTMPSVYVDGCALSIDDYTQTQNGMWGLKTVITPDNEVTASNCDGRKSADLVFNYEGPSTSNTLSCIALNAKIDKTSNLYIQPFENNVAIIADATVSKWYLCNVDLSGNNLVQDDKTVVKGNTLMVQGKTLENWHVASKDGAPGYLFYVKEDGSVDLPAKPDSKKVLRDTVDLSIEVRTYDPYDALRIICDFNDWVAVDMTAINNSYHAYTYRAVKTGDEYACNVINKSTGIQIFNRKEAQRFVFLVNGVQVIRPKGNNLNVVIDKYGEVVVNMVPVHIVCDTSTEFTGPVFGFVGNLGTYASFPMVQNDTKWETNLTLPEGIHEFNIVWEGGAYKALYKDFPDGHAQDCDLYINDALITTTIPYANSYNWISLILDDAVSDQAGADQVIVNVSINLSPVY